MDRFRLRMHGWPIYLDFHKRDTILPYNFDADNLQYMTPCMTEMMRQNYTTRLR